MFSITGKTLLSAGFTEVMSWLALDKDESIPTFREGEILQVADVKLVEKQTGPPDYVTESEVNRDILILKGPTIH